MPSPSRRGKPPPGCASSTCWRISASPATATSTACGGWSGLAASPADFTQHARVMNGASDLAVEVFGAAGRHARTTIGVPALPGGASVEVEGMFEIA